MKAFLFWVILSTVISVSASASATMFYVDRSVSSSGDGTSWETAFKTIQEGVDAASDGDTVTVAQGLYVERVRFNGKNIVLTSTDPLERSVVASTIIDGNRAWSVLSFLGTETEACVLSGFTIQNGNGGGIVGVSHSGGPITHATIKNNIITGNRTHGGNGGGIAGCDGTIENNTISGNSAHEFDERGGYGGGLARCNGTIRNNTITANTAAGDYGGGGLYECDGAIHNNTITGNWGADDGGGLYRCDGTIENNTITGNSADYGGGLSNCDGTIQNNMIAANSADCGGGLYRCDGTVQNNTIVGNSAAWEGGGGLYDCRGAIRNCIIWQNTAPTNPQLGDESSIPTYSCIQGWSGGGEGNVSQDPLFVDPDGPDNDPATYEDNNYRLSAGSPCIGAGMNRDWMWAATDLDGNARVINGTVDMGAYEYISGGDWYVDDSVPSPGDGTSPATAFKTMQEGIDAASDGETVMVLKGTYVENIQFKGKNIVLTSTDPHNAAVVAGTIIDGNQSGSVVRFLGTETEACVLSGFTIQNGKGEDGGAILGGMYPALTRATIRNNIISGNSAKYGGGLCRCNGMIENNTVIGNSAGDGGGLCECSGGIIQNNVITANSANYGGGLYECGGTILNNAITDNSATYSGGGLNDSGGTIQNNLIANNSAGECGGGVYDCEHTIQNNVIRGNSAGQSGGGLYWCYGMIQNNTITANSAGEYGGGLYHCSLTIRNNTIAGNYADCGGGLANCHGTILNNTITANDADLHGGGLYDCDGAIQNNTIAYNRSEYGGGLDGCDGVIQNNVMTCNRAEHGGGLVACNGTIENNTIVDNVGDNGSGGLRDCSGTIRNSIIWHNLGGAPQLDRCSVPTYCCFADPSFLDADKRDFRLRPDSPCIDAGFNHAELPQTDAAGMHRIMFGGKSLTVDMGAHEFHIWPPTEDAQTGEVTLKWSSLAGKTYSVYQSGDMLSWDILSDNVPSAGDTVTTWIDSLGPVLPPGVPIRYYKIGENPVVTGSER